MTLGRPDIQRLLDDHHLRPSRALGQNFVADPNTVRRIARLAGVSEGDPTVEIGAGLGSLTVALAEAGARVLAIEIDRRLVPVLEGVVAERTPQGSVTVVEGDALRLDWAVTLGPDGPGAAVNPRGSPWRLVANLPYNVATAVVLRVLEEAPQVTSLLVMVQREVGERLAARVGDPGYGAVSVRVAYWATATVVGRVPATVFVPRPAVESVLVRLDRRAEPAVATTVVSYARLTKVIRAGFGQRRKMLRRALAGTVDRPAYAAVGVSPEARAEELTIEEWGWLAGWRNTAVEEGPAPSA